MFLIPLLLMLFLNMSLCVSIFVCLQDDLSGDYKKLVLALIREESAGGKK